MKSRSRRKGIVDDGFGGVSGRSLCEPLISLAEIRYASSRTYQVGDGSGP